MSPGGVSGPTNWETGQATTSIIRDQAGGRTQMSDVPPVVAQDVQIQSKVGGNYGTS